MMNNERFNKWFNAFILIGMTAVMVITTAIKMNTAETGQALLIVAAFGALMGVLSTVCSANAKILTFVFGFFNTLRVSGSSLAAAFPGTLGWLAAIPTQLYQALPFIITAIVLIVTFVQFRGETCAFADFERGFEP